MKCNQGLKKDSGDVVTDLDYPNLRADAEEVLRTRADERLTRDGWSNVEWLPMHLSVIEDLSARHTFEYVFDGTLPIAQLVRALGDVMSGQAQR